MSQPSARPATRNHRRGGSKPQNLGLKWLVWLSLCALPAYGALSLWLRGGTPVAAALYAVASLLAFGLYRHDKRRAGQGGWRIPENWLHLVELAGGWPGALLAQQVYRHKTRKVSFQLVFWMIVLLHLAGWVDFVWLGWVKAGL